MIRILNVNSLFFVSLTTHLDFQMKLYIQLLQKTIVFEHVFSERSPFEIKSLAHWLTKYLSAFKNLHAIDECHLN